MKMNFHCAGIMSEENMNEIYMNDKIVVLSESDQKLNKNEFEKLDIRNHELPDGSDYWIFYKDTGKCLNDYKAFGCYRTIDIC